MEGGGLCQSHTNVAGLKNAQSPVLLHWKGSIFIVPYPATIMVIFFRIKVICMHLATKGRGGVVRREIIHISRGSYVHVQVQVTCIYHTILQVDIHNYLAC